MTMTCEDPVLLSPVLCALLVGRLVSALAVHTVQVDRFVL